MVPRHLCVNNNICRGRKEAMVEEKTPDVYQPGDTALVRWFGEDVKVEVVEDRIDGGSRAKILLPGAEAPTRVERGVLKPDATEGKEHGC